MDYVKVKITGAVVLNLSDTYSQVELKAQIKETGGAYGDIVAYTIIKREDFVSGSRGSKNGYTYEIIGTLTAGQKTNGYQVKVFSKSTSAGNATAVFTNIQTILEET